MLVQSGGEVLELPDDLVESESLFKEVLSIEAWNCLSGDEKAALMKRLPDVDSVPEDFSQETIRKIFDGDTDFKNGNPITHAYEELKCGHFCPEAIKMKTKCKKLKYKNYKLQQKEYYQKLLKEIVVQRQAVLDKAYNNSPLAELPKKKPLKEFKFDSISTRVKKKYNKILREVAVECGDNEFSSDEEGGDNKQQKCVTEPSPEDITHEDFMKMFRKHQMRRIEEEVHPELDTTNISLADVIVRCNAMKKPVKVKRSSKKKKGRLKKKVGNSKLNQKGKSNSQKSNGSSNKKHSSLSNSQKLTIEKKKSKEKTKSHGFPKLSSFFSLLGYFFDKEPEKKCTMAKVQEKVALWQTHKSSEMCGWKTLYSNWLPLIQYAIEYLVGKGSGSMLPEFIPLLIPDGENEWMWTGPEFSNDDVILPLCNHWMDTLSKVLSTVNEKEEAKKEKEQITSRSVTTVRKSTEEERLAFQEQEKKRYDTAHKPFIFKTREGTDTIVGPIKGVFNPSEMTSCKAREHPLLVSDRLAYVTILCLVRDAVARLPNGEGTRVDVCTLLKDSQFLSSKSSDTQVHCVVSGALDRLHAEKDPCVKFDGVRKVWIYLHKTRSYEEFEKIHEASAAAALAKKKLSQSQKKKRRATTDQGENGPNAKSTKKEAKKSTQDEGETSMEQPSTTLNAANSDVNNKEAAASIGDPDKKKQAKRKRNLKENAADSSGIKVPKLINTDSSTETLNDLNTSLEKEALMATQSILSIDDSMDNTDFGSDSIRETGNLTLSGYFPPVEDSSTMEDSQQQQQQNFSSATSQLNISNDSITESENSVSNQNENSKPQNSMLQGSLSGSVKSQALPNIIEKTATKKKPTQPKQPKQKRPTKAQQKQQLQLEQQRQQLRERLQQQMQQIKQNQAQQQTQSQKQPPQSPFVITTASSINIGQITLTSKQFVDKIVTTRSSKQEENRTPNVRIVTPISSGQPPALRLGLNLGNLTTSSLQSINQLIAERTGSVPNQNKQHSQPTAIGNINIANISKNPLTISPVTAAQAVLSPTSLVKGQTGKPSLEGTVLASLCSPTPATKTQQLVQHLVPLQASGIKISHGKKVVSATTLVSTKPMTQSTPQQNIVSVSQSSLKSVPANSLTLNQLMAFARAQPIQKGKSTTTLPTNTTQTPTIRGRIRPVSSNNGNTVSQAIQGLVHVISKNQNVNTPSNVSHQLIVQPRGSGTSVARVVRLPKAVLQQASVLRASNPGSLKQATSTIQRPVTTNTLQKPQSQTHQKSATVTLQKTGLTPPLQKPYVGIPIRGRAMVAPLKISLPKTGNFGAGTLTSPVRMISPGLSPGNRGTDSSPLHMISPGFSPGSRNLIFHTVTQSPTNLASPRLLSSRVTTLPMKITTTSTTTTTTANVSPK